MEYVFAGFAVLFISFLLIFSSTKDGKYAKICAVVLGVIVALIVIGTIAGILPPAHVGSD